MESTHVTPELLDSMIQEDLPPAVLSRLLWDHVRALCPVCRENLDLWLERNKAAALREAAEGFVALDVGYDAALTYLDLAETLLAQDKVEEVARLATTVEPVLRVNGLTGEAVAALTLFRNAADRRTLTASLLDELRRKLQQSRRHGG